MRDGMATGNSGDDLPEPFLFCLVLGVPAERPRRDRRPLLEILREQEALGREMERERKAMIAELGELRLLADVLGARHA